MAIQGETKLCVAQLYGDLREDRGRVPGEEKERSRKDRKKV